MWKEGMRVRALVCITEAGGNAIPEINVHFGESPGYVHAPAGGLGRVEYVDSDGVPTVRFDFRDTSTIVGDVEIEQVFVIPNEVVRGALGDWAAEAEASLVVGGMDIDMLKKVLAGNHCLRLVVPGRY